MAEATNLQVQTFCDVRIRPRAEQIRDLIALIREDQVLIPDVYNNANDGASTFADARTDGPPHLLTKSDVLSFNAFTALFLQCIDGTAQTGDVGQLHANLPIVMQACVRPLRS